VIFPTPLNFDTKPLNAKNNKNKNEAIAVHLVHITIKYTKQRKSVLLCALHL
jgi:hypothetical protein